ncbi:hypothetical protein [Bacillus sp. 2205SS5-2]|uniref:hypothetical protein n=1 Tax=Bacillus sp. 2205SS5-2 TaxID=3109031 RepID=UPI003006C040
MNIKKRFFETEADLEAQYQFWIERTKVLPFAWKPTLSPTVFRQGASFHPKSRYFAFEGEKLVGYCSFTGSGDFVSIGYPWVLPGYEGELQEELFQHVVEFATSEEYEGKILAQRFRSQWKKQIQFFESKGFEITGRSKVIGRSSEKMEAAPYWVNSNRSNQFEFEKIKPLVNSSTESNPAELLMLEEYYDSVAFDFAYEFQYEKEICGYFGVTIRKDTGYAEILAPFISQQWNQKFPDMIQAILLDLKDQVHYISIGESAVPDAVSLTSLGFTFVTEDVMLMKKV